MILRAAALLVALLAAAPPLHSQELEPRSYSNVPIGMNFALAGYAITMLAWRVIVTTAWRTRQARRAKARP